MEVNPVRPNICLHHLSAQHMLIVRAITFKQSVLLLCNWGLIGFIESYLDQIHDFLALLFGNDVLWQIGVQKTCDSHRMLLNSWKKPREIHVIGEVCWILTYLVIVNTRMTSVRDTQTIKTGLLEHSWLQTEFHIVGTRKVRGHSPGICLCTEAGLCNLRVVEQVGNEIIRHRKRRATVAFATKHRQSICWSRHVI